MRLLNLNLARYGHLADVRLDFPRAARLHVVLGPNEAGKSTALAAIGDALFGFPHRTDFAYRFESAQLRLGFEVEAADGTRESFIRLKRNKNPLLDGAEQPVAEAALARLLGGAARSLFETTYGLNGETLRRGALALLASGGEAGESLLAGMGLQNLRSALERLDEQAKELAGSRKHNQALNLALDAWKAARDAAEEAAIRPREWTDAKAELDAVRAAMQTAREEAAALRAEESRLRRAQLVRPVLAALDASRQELAGLADAPALPGDAAATLVRLRNALRQAEEDARRETAEAERLEAQHAALPQDAPILAEADAIAALAARHQVVADALRDLPGVERAVEAWRAQVTEAAALLDQAAGAEAIRDAVPPSPARQKAQRLITRRAELAVAADSATRSLAEAERKRDAAAARLAAAAPPKPSGPLRRAVAAARGEGPLDRELATAERRLAEAADRTATALAALPGWSGDAAFLAALPLPLESEESALAARLATATAAEATAQDSLARIVEERIRLEGEVVTLGRGGTVPTPEAIATARALRERAWRLLRAQLDGTPPGPRDGLPEGPLPDVFEALRDAADRLADARAEDAGRVATYAEKTARLGWLAERQIVAQAEQDEASARRAAAEVDWAGPWRGCGLVPANPAAMQEWRRLRADVLRLRAQEAEAAQRRDDIVATLAASRAPLLRLLPGTTAPTLGELLDAAEEHCAALEATEQAYAGLAAQVAAEDDRAAEAGRLRDGAAAELASLSAEWDAAMAALRLDAGATPAAAEGALEAWARIAEAATAWRNDATRIAAMRAEITTCEAALAAVLDRLGGTAEGEATPSVVTRLSRRLSQAKDSAKAAQALAAQAQARRAAAAAAQERAASALGELAALRMLARAEDIEALDAAIGRSDRRAALTDHLRALVAELARLGDGLEEARLRAEALALDPDAARARLEEIEDGDDARAARLTQLGARQQAVETRLAAMDAGRDAAVHAQAARQHLAAAQEAAEHYARLHLARSLLQGGIERLRAERQGPLLRAAGEQFALLTTGRYPRLEADETEAGQVMLQALRMDGTRCPLASLSEGTRDQLYLALRVASVEQHAAGAEPLPFIADDLLATFDDGRAAAALELLARLGGTVQTILFTHHAHLAELAARMPGVAVLELPAA